jgi:DNA-binding NarL/FixJ family response regulator
MGEVQGDIIMFNKHRILVAEDNPMVAWDLTLAVEDADGVVMGPFDTVAGALSYLESHSVSGAILDVELKDRNVSPLAQELLKRGTPMVFQSGQKLPEALSGHQPGLPIFSKLVDRHVLIEKLVSLIQTSDAASIDALAFFPTE